MYSTLWEADNWATRGGLEKIDWSKAPFYAYYKDFDIEGCAMPGPANCASNPSNWWEGAAYQALNSIEARRYRWVRVNHVIVFLFFFIFYWSMLVVSLCASMYIV